MTNKYKCYCGHTVHSASKEPPESLNWSDGHACILTLVKKGDDNESSNSSKTC